MRPTVRVPFVVVLAAALLAFAPAAQAEAKLGFFDLKKVLSEIEDAKAAKSKLQRDFEAKQKQLDSEREGIEKLRTEFEQKAPVLSQTAKEQLAMELQNKAIKAQQLYVELQGDLADKERAALSDVFAKLEPVVREVATAEGYTFIFEKNETGLYIGPDEHDLTSQVIRRYNAKWGKKKPAEKKADKKAEKKADAP